MTTSLAFVKTGLENKIEFADLDTNLTFNDMKEKVMEQLSQLNKAPDSKGQLKFIYAGRILNDDDSIKSIINPDIEPPYTLQILIRPEGSKNPEAPQADEETGCKCLLL